MQPIESMPEPITMFASAGFAPCGVAAVARAAERRQVRIVRGLLAGLVGTVREWTAESRCVLEVEGFPEGVWLVVDKVAVEDE